MNSHSFGATVTVIGYSSMTFVKQYVDVLFGVVRFSMISAREREIHCRGSYRHPGLL
jgi:hypothetical protein